MKYHANRLTTDDSHEISYLIFSEFWERYVAKFVVCFSHDWRLKGLMTTKST